MNQLMIAAVCRIIVGPTGRRMPAYRDIQAAYTQGLFADYFSLNPMVSVKTCYKYANRTAPFPHFLEQHYGGSKGYRRTLGDMMGVVDSCPSITLLWQIQSEVYRWVETHLQGEVAFHINENYVNTNASRSQIARYLAVAVHFAVTENFVECRPTDIDPAL